MEANTGRTPSPSSSCRFSTIAVLDLETSNLPMYNNNRTSITELCIYGFAAENLRNQQNNKSGDAGIMTDSTRDAIPAVPSTPRVLHKLTLLLNPLMIVHPSSEMMTGLNNFLLEHESAFDENAANTVLGFLQHLQQPVCLVAHNGWSFDFPIVKQTFQKLKKELPESVVCVDSLRAFLEIDRKRLLISSHGESTVPKSLKALKSLGTIFKEEVVANVQDSHKVKENAKELPSLENEFNEGTKLICLEEALNENSQFNWRKINETTPKRAPSKTISSTTQQSENGKRKLISDTNGVTTEQEPHAKKLLSDQPSPVPSKARRSLRFAADASPVFKKYPPRGVYKLDKMFERIFKQPPVHAHHAEADVDMLMKLVLYYGEDFISYAEQHGKPFSEVPPLGRY